MGRNHQLGEVFLHALPETNVAPEHLAQKKGSSPNHHFGSENASFRECKISWDMGLIPIFNFLEEEDSWRDLVL